MRRQDAANHFVQVSGLVFELSFIKDNGVKHGADIAAILKTLETERSDIPETETEEEDV